MSKGIVDLILHILKSPSGKSKKQEITLPEEPRAITPQHVAIIMDGNGRWATKRHLPRGAGHRAGVEALHNIVEAAPQEGIQYLTVYAFSTENWGRPKDEVDGLMDLFWDSFNRYLESLRAEGVRIRHFGRLQELRPDIQQGISNAVETTKNNSRLNLNVCLNYGGRAEILDAIRAVIASGVPSDRVTEEMITAHMYSHDIPDPDLIIRTAGEMRLSNFLVWQSAYSEYYSTPTLFPDFDRNELVVALNSFAQRKRKFGKIGPEHANMAYLAKDTEARAKSEISRS